MRIADVSCLKSRGVHQHERRCFQSQMSTPVPDPGLTSQKPETLAAVPCCGCDVPAPEEALLHQASPDLTANPDRLYTGCVAH